MKRLLYIILFFSALSTLLLIYSLTKKPEKESAIDDSSSIILKEMMASNLINSGIHINDVYLYRGLDTVPFRFYNVLNDNCLVYRFSGEACDVCIDFALAMLQQTFPDFKENRRVILIGSNLNKRVLEKYYPKEVLYLKGELLGLPSEEYYTPLLFVINGSGITRMTFTPEKSMPDLTRAYLEKVKSTYFDFKQKVE